ncbi:MAG: hypothetical protein MI747_23490 [Desulfobacterales bacterium]|nr:hypothetical protein [Desulfobacterales bacterium]
MAKQKQSSTGSGIIRKVLPNVNDFKEFWENQGPFAYALTSQAFPPILMEEEEWIFGTDLREVLKALMQFKERKMAFVQAPFNAENTGVLRPEELIPWQVRHFPEEWNRLFSDAFVPEGYLTSAVAEAAGKAEDALDRESVEDAFFQILEQDLEGMGYLLLSPRGKYRYAVVRDYVEEWEADESDAGLI